MQWMSIDDTYFGTTKSGSICSVPGVLGRTLGGRRIELRQLALDRRYNRFPKQLLGHTIGRRVSLEIRLIHHKRAYFATVFRRATVCLFELGKTALICRS